MSLAFLPSDEVIFLNSEPQWKSRLGPGWVGTKILGQGGHGVAALWEYKGPSSNAPSITQVVVKMSEAQIPQFPEPETFPRSKIDEGITLKQLAACKSKHIVKIFGGNRLSDRFEQMGEVVRIFLEYCPGGDVGRFLAPYGEVPLLPLQEVDVWALFHCMALGVVVMERGTENEKERAWQCVENYELVHFDLKAENVLLGKRDEGHIRMPIAKIGDFGEAYSVKKPSLQLDHDGSLASKRGTEYYQPPEETLQNPYHAFANIPCPWPRKGTCSNIWQIGTIMNQLLLRVQKRFDDAPAALRYKPTSFNPSALKLVAEANHSLDLETPEILGLYSVPLITLVMECLLRPTNVRPTAIELVRRTEEGYQTALLSLDAVGITKGKDKPLPPNPEMQEIPFMSVADPEPPLAWEVDDTTHEYLYQSRLMSQKNVHLSPPSSVSRGSRWSGLLPSIFSRGRTRSPSLGTSLGSRGSGMFGSSPEKWRPGLDAEIEEGWEEVVRIEEEEDVVMEDNFKEVVGKAKVKLKVKVKEEKDGSPTKGKKNSPEKLKAKGGVVKSSPKKKSRK